MEKRIVNKLYSIATERGVEIINARQRGSRMLGVAHDDSDYDVMFLFAQDSANYAKLRGHIDTIDRPGEDIDLHGWNIDKFGGLLSNSNPNAIEYVRENPKEYITFYGDTFDALAKDARESFNHMALYHHYISMAKRNWKKYVDSGNDPTRSRQFYVARALGCAQHIRRDGTMPSMDAFELAREGNMNPTLSDTIERLASAKQSGKGGEETADVVGHLYLAESEVPMEPTEERCKGPDKDLIDAFIGEVVVR